MSPCAAATFIQAVEERQGMMISSVEEIAYRMGYIPNRQQLLALADGLNATNYGAYLKRLAGVRHAAYFVDWQKRTAWLGVAALLTSLVITYDYPEIDLGKPTNCQTSFIEFATWVIVNITAYTNVDKAENEAGLARQINAISPGVLAEEARRLGAAFAHYSTDYVFDGSKGAPYVESLTPLIP